MGMIPGFLGLSHAVRRMGDVSEARSGNRADAEAAQARQISDTLDQFGEEFAGETTH